jgi:hypothetical protein
MQRGMHLLLLLLVVVPLLVPSKVCHWAAVSSVIDS